MRPTDIAEPVPGGVRVLVAEGGEDDAVILTAMLRLRGFDARAARTAAAALEVAVAARPQVLVLDPDLPDWRDLLDRLRAAPDPPAVVFLTAHASAAWRATAAEAGAAAYLLKPADVEELVQLLQRLTAG
jgi:two-component system OmpR family response regulator